MTPAPSKVVSNDTPRSRCLSSWSPGSGGAVWYRICAQIAYVRTGYGQARLNGTAAAGVLYLTGQNDARLAAHYDAARAVGYVIADLIRYTFAAPAVHGTAASSQSAA
jgi:hypothetical protein